MPGVSYQAVLRMAPPSFNRLVDHVPRPDVACEVLGDCRNGILDDLAPCSGVVGPVCHPLSHPSRYLLMPDKAVSTNQHIVLLGKPDELSAGEKSYANASVPDADGWGPKFI